MATVDQQQSTASTNGTGDAIVVENPATGEVVRSLAVTTPAELAEMVARARAAQPGWEAIGY